MKKIYRFLLIVCIIVFVFSAYMIAEYWYKGYQSQKSFEILQSENTITELHKKNEHTAGWIKIEGTKLNYSVMYTPGDNEYYLRRNFEGEYSASGTPFIDGNTDLQSSMNRIIYGHHMYDGTMFGVLQEYEKEEFYENHREIIVFSNDGTESRYRIFAFGKTDATSEEFNVYKYININNRKQYEEYVSGLKNLSSINTGIVPEYGEKIITLSTCSYHSEYGRYIVAGVLEKNL